MTYTVNSFFESIILNHNYEVIELNYDLPDNVHHWCTKNFGNPGYRWFVKYRKIYFRDSKDYLLFLLRWNDE